MVILCIRNWVRFVVVIWKCNGSIF